MHRAIGNVLKSVFLFQDKFYCNVTDIQFQLFAERLWI